MQRRYWLFISLGLLLIVGALWYALDDKNDLQTLPDGKYSAVVVTGKNLPSFSDKHDYAVGQTAPVVRGTDINGDGSILAERGHPLLLFVISTQCNCQAQLRSINEQLHAHFPTGLEVELLSTKPGNNPKKWLADSGWQTAPFIDNRSQDAARAYGLTTYPSAILINSDGVVVQRVSGDVTGKLSSLVALAKNTEKQ